MGNCDKFVHVNAGEGVFTVPCDVSGEHKIHHVHLSWPDSETEVQHKNVFEGD